MVEVIKVQGLVQVGTRLKSYLEPLKTFITTDV